jgi:uncharacterized protein (TIGR03437 family)
MPSQKKECGRTAFRRAVAVGGLLLCGAFSAASQTPEAAGALPTRPMALVRTRYEVRMGEPQELAAAPETVEFLAHARTRQVALEGQKESGLVVGPSQARDRILLAASSKANPGEYAVTLSATGETGEVRQTVLDVVVKPLAAVAAGSTRPPVVLLNGWQIGFSNTCPIAADSSTTFGNLAQYLVSDGVPVVYLFDNCAEDPGQPIETLGNDLNTFLNSIKYTDGTQVPQIARAYLSGLQPNGTYLPPAVTLVRKLVLIATPNFGSFVASNYATAIPAGTQAAEMEPGSAFLWNLATWNQHLDDLRGADAIAIVGNAGTYTNQSTEVALANGSDGLVSLTSAALGFVTPAPAANRTQIVPYCHIDPAAFTNINLGAFNCNAPGIANVTSTSHYTGQIVRSFLAGTTAWSSVGTIPTANTYLVKNGGMFFAWQNSTGKYVSDMSQVVWGTVQFQNGGDTGTIFYTDFVYGTGPYTATSASLGSVNCGSVTGPTGHFAAIRCKQGAAISSVTPLSTTAAGEAVSAGATITLNGANFGTQCGNCQVLATPAGATASQALAVTSWQSTAISVKLPASLTGFVTIAVDAVAGVDAIGVMVVSQSTLAVTPASLSFAYTVGGTAPPAQSLQISNSGTGTLAWSAATSLTWLSWTAASGTAPSTLSVSALPAGMSPGTYTGTIQVTATGANNSPATISVTLTVTPAPASLAVGPQALTFQYTQGGALPAAQSISIANGGTGALSWTAAGGAFWTTLSAASGATPGTLSITVNPANVAPGSNTATVTIAASDPSLSPVAITVTLVVQGAPTPGTITAVANAANYQPTFASATWVAIFGTNLSQLTYSWQTSDFVNGMLPTSLKGATVTINGLPAYISFISPTQINVLAPDDAAVGPVPVQVTTAQQASNTATAQKNQFSPAFLTFDGAHVAALHLDYSYVGAANLLPGVTTTPAKPTETIVLYGTGFGPSTPPLPSGQVVGTAASLANTVTVTIGGAAAPVTYSGQVGSGLYQFNVTIPSLPNGDAAVLASIGNLTTPAGAVITVGQ